MVMSSEPSNALLFVAHSASSNLAGRATVWPLWDKQCEGNPRYQPINSSTKACRKVIEYRSPHCLSQSRHSRCCKKWLPFLLREIPRCAEAMLTAGVESVQAAGFPSVWESRLMEEERSLDLRRVRILFRPPRTSDEILALAYQWLIRQESARLHKDPSQMGLQSVLLQQSIREKVR